jgi:hypothetical protein
MRDGKKITLMIIAAETLVISSYPITIITMISVVLKHDHTHDDNNGVIYCTITFESSQIQAEISGKPKKHKDAKLEDNCKVRTLLMMDQNQQRSRTKRCSANRIKANQQSKLHHKQLS